MYDFFNILAGIFLIGTVASIVYVIIKAVKQQFTKQLFAIPVILFLIYLVICAVSPEKPVDDSKFKETATVTEATTTVSKATEAPATEATTTEPETTANETTESVVKEHTAESLNGRGNSDAGREEPQYVNVIGYVAIPYNDYSITQSDDFIETPWEVAKYKKDKQFYVEDGTVDHKTEVVVRSQELEHEGYGAYSGYLLVEQLDTNEQFYINVSNFITKPYWTYSDLNEAVSIGYYIAEYKQTSDYYPVNSSNEKVELDDGINVLVVRKTGTYGRRGPDCDTNSIEAIVFKEWSRGYGGVSVFFNQQDLSIIY